MILVNMNSTLTQPPRREIAYFRTAFQQDYPGSSDYCSLGPVTARANADAAASLRHRYPSPDRPAYSPSRSITEIRLSGRKNRRDIGYHGEIAIHRGADCTNCGAIDITTLGLRLCKRHQSSSQRWQYLVWQVALIMTWSAASSAQVAASWLQNCLVQTAQALCLQVPLSACSATTQAYALAAKVDHRAHRGRTIKRNRRRGVPPVAVFSFLGT